MAPNVVRRDTAILPQLEDKPTLCGHRKYVEVDPEGKWSVQRSGRDKFDGCAERGPILIREGPSPRYDGLLRTSLRTKLPKRLPRLRK
jgi:hypothetical protein